MRPSISAATSLASDGKRSRRSRRDGSARSSGKPKFIDTPAPSAVQHVKDSANTLVAGLVHLLRQFRLLTVLLQVVQHLLYKMLSVLQWVNDFPARVQFRRTTQRFLSVMNTTESYATFVDAAASLDHYCGVAQWTQEAPPIEKCDAVGLLIDALAAQELVESHNISGMEVFLSSLLKRNAHGLMDPSIYNYFTCPKCCIEDYTNSIEALIAAYAGTDAEGTPTPVRPSPSPSGVVSQRNSLAPTSLRACWVRLDALPDGVTGSGASQFTSPPSQRRPHTLAAKPHHATALPAIDLAAKVRQVWRATAVPGRLSLYAQHHHHLQQQPQLTYREHRRFSSTEHTSPASQRMSRSMSDTTAAFSRLSSAASTLAPATTTAATAAAAAAAGVARGTVSHPKPSPRTLFPSQSVGEETNYLTEDDLLPMPSSYSAHGAQGFGGRALAEGTSTELPASISAASLASGDRRVGRFTRAGTFNDVGSALGLRDAKAPSHAARVGDHPLLRHMEASCAALHRFIEGNSSRRSSAAPSATPSPLPAPEQPSVQHRIEVLQHVLHSFGRTALVLSGGASMGTYHAGVVRALYEAKVLPDILCGSSAGSIIAAFVCTKTPAELDSFMKSDVLSTEAMQISPFGEDASIAEKLRRFFKTGFLMDVRSLMECMRGQCGDLTFLEAHELSGKVLNVSVTRSQQKGTHADRHVLLNYVTAPDVVIWSAVSASCALPGLFTAVQLIEKPPSAGGGFAPYLPGELWCDGSVAQDIPRRLLTQLFGVDYLIVSQVNPYVIPFLKPAPSYLVVAESPSLLSRVWFLWVALWGVVLTVLFSLRLLPRTGAGEVLFLPFAQDYGGDVTIYPVESLLTAAPDYMNLVNNPSAEYISYVASRAQGRTWPLITRIRLATAIERRLIAELQSLQQMQYNE